MKELKEILMERLERRKKELIDVKLIMAERGRTDTKFWDGKRIMLEGVTGEIPFLEKTLKWISEQEQEC